MRTSGALQVPDRLGEQFQRLAVVAEQLQEVAGGLDGGAIPGAEGERLPRRRQRLVDAVLALAQGGALDEEPGRTGGDLLGAGEPGFGVVEVAQGSGDDGVEGEPGGAQVGGRVGQVAAAAEEVPGRQRAAPLQHGVGPVVAGFRVRGVVVPGPVVEATAELRRAELHGQAAGEDAAVGAGPVVQGAERAADVEGLQEQAAVVEPAHLLQRGGGESDEVGGRGGGHGPALLGPRERRGRVGPARPRASLISTGPAPGGSGAITADLLAGGAGPLSYPQGSWSASARMPVRDRATSGSSVGTLLRR
jgi:hypothetical protein